MSNNAKHIQTSLLDIKSLGQQILSQAKMTRQMVTDGQWDKTIFTLVQMLDEGAVDAAKIRKDLETTSRDLNALKSQIESMIANA